MHIVISWYDSDGGKPKITPCVNVDQTINATIADVKLGMESSVYSVEDNGHTFRRVSGPDLCEEYNATMRAFDK